MTSMKWDLDTALAVTKSEGVEEGEKNGRWKTLVELVRKGYLSIKLAAKEAGMSEAEFRWEHNQDAMAVEKLSEGIRLFAVDQRKLEDLLAAKL